LMAAAAAMVVVVVCARVCVCVCRCLPDEGWVQVRMHRHSGQHCA
jgi:hypothetical protein